MLDLPEPAFDGQVIDNNKQQGEMPGLSAALAGWQFDSPTETRLPSVSIQDEYWTQMANSIPGTSRLDSLPSLLSMNWFSQFARETDSLDCPDCRIMDVPASVNRA
jgi:hypothetical protein